MRRHVLRPRRTILAVALTLVPSAALAYLGSATITSGPPIEREPIEVFVTGSYGDPCFETAFREGLSGLVEPDVVRLVLDLVDTSGGNPCATVITPYDASYVFEEGFAAGTYTLEVIERYFLGDLLLRSEQIDLDLVVSESDGPVATAPSAWGAVKALYGSAR